MNLFNEMEWRDLVHTASDGMREVFGREKLTAYIGFDPSAASLHVGSLLPIMGLARLQRFGHKPIAIVGGGTGLIGDPSGKTAERSLLNKQQVEANLIGIREQLSRFLDFDAKDNAALLVNNADWLCSIPLVDFLRDVGKYFTVNMMLQKESVKRRIEQQDGISYTEFSYLLLQSFDFLVLYDRYGCTLQMGGSDQWGNITAGFELIRKLRGGKAHGLVFPLVTSATGVKFGKTEAGTIWLDAQLTSPYRFYQFWINTDDQDVIRYLKFFTWLPEPEITVLAEEVKSNPGGRAAQKTLAKLMTEMLHGATGLAAAEQATAALFGGKVFELSLSEILDVLSDAPSSTLADPRLSGDGLPVVELLIAAGLAASKGEAKRAISGGGMYLNDRRIESDAQVVRLSDTLEQKILVLRKGRKQYHLIQLG